MGCVQTSGKPETLHLTWAADAKGYNPTELGLLTTYIDQTIAWLGTIGYTDGDVCCYRVGIPVLPSGNTTFIEELYTLELPENDYIMNSVEIDMIKITAKGTCHTGFNNTYTYKSTYNHKILANYFIDGVNNATEYITPPIKGPFHITFPGFMVTPRYTYIDEPEYNCNVSKYAGLNAQYDGVRQTSLPTIEIPSYVVKCFNMIAQNMQLVSELSETSTGEKKGDLVYLSIPKLIHKLTLAKTRSDEKFFNEYYEDLHYIMTETGLDQAFKDLKYGGMLEKLDLIIRVPASYENEKLLRSYLEDKDVAIHCNKTLTTITDADRNTYFNYVFEARMVDEEAYTDKGISDHTKKDMLLDVDILNEALNRIKAISDSNYQTISNDDLWTVNQWFDTSYIKTDIGSIKALTNPNYSMTKGCKFQETSLGTDGKAAYTDENGVYHEAVPATDSYTYNVYRHYHVRASWLDAADYARVSAIFWTGFDISTSTDTRCDFDMIIIIIIIIYLAYQSGGAIDPESGMTIAQMLIYGSAIISIGLTIGAFGTGKTARNMAILAALMSLGGSSGINYTTAAGWTATNLYTVGFALSVAGTGLAVYQTLETFKFDEDMAELTAELAVLNAASMYESDLRFVYEDSYRWPQTMVEKDPYDSIRNIYEPFTTYKTKGFSTV